MANYDYLYDKNHYLNMLEKKHFVEKKLSWKTFHNAMVLPFAEIPGNLGGGIVDDQGKYIDGSGLHKGIGAGYEIAGKTVVSDDSEIVFLGLWSGVWGHAITDNIRRLWVLYDSDFMNAYAKHRFVYISIEDHDLNSNFKSLLQVLGIEHIKLERVDTITKYRAIILPDECIWNHEDTKQYSEEYVSMIDRVRRYGEEQFSPNSSNKVYYSHRKYAGWRGLGERKIERYFEKMGYEIVFPEEHSFNEQLNILLNCTEFASTCGSSSHNCIFLRDHSKVYLIPRGAYIPNYQFALDDIHELDVTYIDSTLSLYTHPEHPWTGPFFYIVSEQLQKCFQKPMKSEVRRIVFEIYRQLAFSVNQIIEPEEYYKDIRADYLPFFDYDRKFDNRFFLRLLSKLKIPKMLAYLVKWLESRDYL